jgi:hypothetical protein
MSDVPYRWLRDSGKRIKKLADQCANLVRLDADLETPTDREVIFRHVCDW